jgi:hypothetical protein
MLVAFVSCVAPAGAQPSIQLELRHGRVWLAATDAPLAAILSEWSHIGGVKIVNGDAVHGEPLTLELTGVSEREALDVLLRGTAGYIVAARAADAGDSSTFDRILILPAPGGGLQPTPPAAGRPDPIAPQSGDSSLPEPLATLVRYGLAGDGKQEPLPRGEGVDRDGSLPAPLVDLIRATAAAGIPRSGPTASEPVPSVRPSSDR